jgi:hypothetical protein
MTQMGDRPPDRGRLPKLFNLLGGVSKTERVMNFPKDGPIIYSVNR